MHVVQNWPNLEKHRPFLQFSSKLSDFFWWKIWQIVFFFLCSLAFGSILFWLGYDAWKMDDLFQRPLGPISIILNFSKKILVKAEIPQLSSKKIWEVLMKIEGIQAISASDEQIVNKTIKVFSNIVCTVF